MKQVSNGFKMLMSETDGVGQALMRAIEIAGEKSALDKKTHELAYISVLVTMKMYSGLPFHIQQAIELGADKEEIKSAMLVPLPIIGIQVAEALTYLQDVL